MSLRTFSFFDSTNILNNKMLQSIILKFICPYRLAISDCLLIVDSFVQKSIIPHFTKESPIDPLWFKVTFPYIWHPFKGVIVTITIYMIVAVSAERFRAVCYPLSKRHVISFSNINQLFLY